MLACFCESIAACAERQYMSKKSREATKSTVGAFCEWRGLNGYNFVEILTPETLQSLQNFGKVK